MMQFATALLAAMPLASASPVPNNGSVPGVVHMPINKIKQQDIGNLHMPHLNNKLDENGQPVQYPKNAQIIEGLANQRYFYKAEVNIGTPPQKLSLLVDTGSSDTWVFTSNTDRGRGRKSKGSVADSTFNPGGSSTFKSNNSQWMINYGKGSASGTWGHDVFEIGGTKLNSLSIGIANQVSDVNTGLIGVGRPVAETTYIHNGQQYNNLPLQLQAEGFINSAAYSLALNDLNSPSGSLIFGGVDHDLYDGALAEITITHESHFGIPLHGISPKGGRADQNCMKRSKTAILDSGTSLTYVDSETLDTLRVALDTNPSFTIGMKYYCNCNITKQFDFDFGKITIPVPAYNILWPMKMFVDKVTLALAFPANSCYFGMESTGKDEDFLLLGDNVLRAMYIVYDITGNRIGLGKAKASSGKPNIEPIMPNQPLPGAH